MGLVFAVRVPRDSPGNRAKFEGNFGVKTSRVGRPHDLYWGETFEKLLHISLTRRLHFKLYDRWYIANNVSDLIYLPFTNVTFYIGSVLCNF